MLFVPVDYILQYGVYLETWWMDRCLVGTDSSTTTICNLDGINLGTNVLSQLRAYLVRPLTSVTPPRTSTKAYWLVLLINLLFQDGRQDSQHPTTKSTLLEGRSQSQIRFSWNIALGIYDCVGICRENLIIFDSEGWRDFLVRVIFRNPELVPAQISFLITKTSRYKRTLDDFFFKTYSYCLYS